MVCGKCGLPLLGTEAFCPQCGAAVRPAAAAPDRPTPADPVAPAREETSPSEVQPEPVEPKPAPAAEPPTVEALDIPLAAPGAERESQAPTEPLEADTPSESPAWLADQAPAEPIVPGREICNEPTFEPRRRRNVLIGPLGLGILAGCFVFFAVALGLLGWNEGMRLRTQKQNQAAASYYTQGLTDMQNGDYERAAAEFEQALRLRPDFPEAEQQLLEARQKASNQPTPTPQAQGQAPKLLADGQAAYDKGAWDDAIQSLETLEKLDPSYEQATVQRLLVGAYTNSGIKRVNDGSLEEAIRLFNQALTLQPDNPDVKSQLQLATLYQSAISVWGVDWGQAIKRFSALYAIKPDYLDTSQRLRQADVAAGDAAGKAGTWCDAVKYYNAALALATDADVAAKRDDAAQRCAAPTPTKAPDETPVPSGTFVGTFKGYQDNTFRTHDWATIQGQVVDTQDKPVPNVKVRLSAYDWHNTVTTATDGTYKFEFLNNELTFTVSLEGVPMQPVDVKSKFGYVAVVDFQQK